MEMVPEGKFGVLQIWREKEFAPIKNKDEDGRVVDDSPESATQLFLSDA